MHYSFLLILSSIFIAPVTRISSSNEKPAELIPEITTGLPATLNLQSQAESRMTAVEFKNQQYCRVELKDFEFDVRFTVVSAKVYFTGAGFETAQTGTISSSSLKSIATLKDKCKPGSVVIFDDVKVKGPDNEIRTIDGATYRLL